MSEEPRPPFLSPPRRRSQRLAPRIPTTVNDVPHDVLLTIFSLLDKTWARRSLPLVCKEWRDLLSSSPAADAFYETLVLDLSPFGAGHGGIKASRVLEWAVKHASAIRKLRIGGVIYDEDAVDGGDGGGGGGGDDDDDDDDGNAAADEDEGGDKNYDEDEAEQEEEGYDPPNAEPDDALRHWSDTRVHDFFSEDLGALVSILSNSLTEITIDEGHSALLASPFWQSLWAAVVPGRLRSLVVDGIQSSLSEKDVGALSRLANLEELQLSRGGFAPSIYGRSDVDARSGFRWGLRRFPERLTTSMTRLTRLELAEHVEVERIPSSISSLGNLRELSLGGCSLASLPAELGALTRLTMLNLEGNGFCDDFVDGDDDGGEGEDEEQQQQRRRRQPFPEAALRGLTSLARLNLARCSLVAVPSFVASLSSLEDLNFSGNEFIAPEEEEEEEEEEEAVVASPPDFGLPATSTPVFAALTRVDLSSCGLYAVPSGVVSAMPRLQVLKLEENLLVELPNDFGESLRDLRELDLSFNTFEAFPVAALAGATSLERLLLCGNDDLEIVFGEDEDDDDDDDEEEDDEHAEEDEAAAAALESLLLEGLPRLCLANFRKREGPMGWNVWSRRSRKILDGVAAALRARNVAVFYEPLEEMLDDMLLRDEEKQQEAELRQRRQQRREQREQREQRQRQQRRR